MCAKSQPLPQCVCRELAGQLREEVVQQVKAKGIKLYLVSLGPPDRGTEFAKHTGFPEDQLLADPESAVYEALSLHNSALDTFFNPKVLLAALFCHFSVMMVVSYVLTRHCILRHD